MSLHVKQHRFTGLPADFLQALIGARRARGWSQRELASKVGLPQVHISAIETGKVSPRFGTLLDLVRVLGFDLMLVPSPLVPAAQALVRDFQRRSSGKPVDDDRPLYAVDDNQEIE
jgi:transcriptional regulator with XRE-family HTH domain